MVHLAKRRFDIVNDQQIILLVIPPIFLVIATAVVIQRWRARQAKRINTLVEDLLCLCGLIMSLLVVIIIFVLVLVDGQGMNTEEVKQHFGSIGYRFWLRTQFAVDCCWATSVTAIHLSLLQFYTRLYDTRKIFLYTCYAMMGMVAAWYVYAIAAWAYHCHPPGACAIASKGNCIVIGSLHVAFNALVMLLAVPALLCLELTSIRKKVSVLGLFLLGSFCTICAILRMDCVFPFFADIKKDPIGAAWGRMLFSPLEIAVGIIACSIPTLTPFHERWRADPRRPQTKDGPMHSLRRLKFRSGSSGSSTSNLNPANWVGKNAGHNNAFVSLEECGKSSERVKDLGGHDIKVTKEYNVVHRT